MADYFKVIRSLAWLIIFFVGMIGPQAVAQTVLEVGPIYNPESKSYFELRSTGPIRWRHVRDKVANLQFKGVQGRLAIIDSYATHMFLMEKFQLRHSAWIGLYVDCKTMNAYWINGKQQSNNEINLWRNPYYNHYTIHCAV